MGCKMDAPNSVVRVAATADLHFTRASPGTLQPILADITKHADILVLCGDLTDHGLPEEAQIVVKELHAVARMPMIGVLGNHDFEAGRQPELLRIFADAAIHILDV